MDEEQLALNEFLAAIAISDELERTRPSKAQIDQAVADLSDLASMNCGASDDLRHILSGLIGQRSLQCSALDARNKRAVLILVQWILSGGSRSATAVLEQFASAS